MSNIAYERMRESLEQLHLARALELIDPLLDRAANGELTTVDLLDKLFSGEVAIRRERSIAMRLKLAGLPTAKTLEQFILNSSHLSMKLISVIYILYVSWLTVTTFCF
jgi:DNA replication protein DnaC